jgi:hypothetical protein
MRLGVRGRTAALAKARELGLIAEMRPTYPLGEHGAPSADTLH